MSHNNWLTIGELQLTVVRFHTPPYKLTSLVNVLKLANMWKIPKLREWAILQIGKLPFHAMSLAEKLQLSIIYKVPEWFDSAFGSLAFTDLRDIPRKDFDTLGFNLSFVFLRLYCQIEDHRKLMAFVAPPCHAHDVECIADPHRHTKCENAWVTSWILIIGQNILHPNHIMAFTVGQINAAVQKLKVPKMQKACLEEAVKQALEKDVPSGIFTLITGAAESVKKDVGFYDWEKEFKEDAEVNKEVMDVDEKTQEPKEAAAEQ